MINRNGFVARTVGWSTALLVLFASTLAADENAERHFTLKVLPILKDKCLGCHGGDSDNLKGEFSVLSRADFLRGGESGDPAIVPGIPGQGTLLDAISWANLEMPPKENDRLSAAQIDLFRQWIKDGAVWPDLKKQEQYRDEAARKTQTAEGLTMPTSGGTSIEWTNRRYQPDDLWAFRPVQTIDVPAGKNPVDYLIQQRLDQAQVQPADQAAPLTLIRRTTFDLTGLPPTPDEIRTFRSAWKTDPEQAWNDLIDRLLASPHYGERWGQHWLDVARYADTAGYSNDYERSNMWRYRDYVIRAFNEDKPYNRLRRRATRRRRTLGTSSPMMIEIRNCWSHRVFLRMGPWDPAMVKVPEARQLYLDDVVNSVGQTFSGDDDAMLQMSRSQIRSAADPGLLPHVRRRLRVRNWPNARPILARREPGRI